MLFSKACEYGIRVVLFLAASDAPGYIPVRRIADRCGVPVHYLGKICGQLTQSGVLHSHKGPNGGVALSRPAQNITLLDVVVAIDGTTLLERCVLGLEPCANDVPCPVHDKWGPIRADIRSMLEGKTVRQLAEELESGATSLTRVLTAS